METDATAGGHGQPRSRWAQAWEGLVNFSPALVMGLTLATRDASDYHVLLRIASGLLGGVLAQGVGFFAVSMGTLWIKQLLGLPVPKEPALEPFAPEMVGSLLFAACLWAWASAEDKYLPGELADCFSYEVEAGRMPDEEDIKWCMEGIQQRRADSYQDSEW